MTDPAAYPHRILLAVTGLSPQIVTETLYALAVKGTPRWVPTGIRIITTRQGAKKAERMSLPGWLRRLCGDYDLPEIAFGVEDIRIIKRPNGKPLDDILDEDDNAAVADFITEEMRELTADPESSLHVSIAGGRKTMGFYVGYALSLFGREQDRLSHVLVPPSLELSAFFYPRPGAADAQVHLGTIPFVRLRQELPDHLLQGRAPLLRGRRRSAEGAAAAGARSRSGDANGNRRQRELRSGAGPVRLLLDDGREVRGHKGRGATERSRPRRRAARIPSASRGHFRADGKSLPEFQRGKFRSRQNQGQRSAEAQAGRASGHAVSDRPARARFPVRASIDSGSGCRPRRSRSPQACRCSKTSWPGQNNPP